MLPLGVVILIIAAASGYFIFFANDPPKPASPAPQQALDQLKQTTQLVSQSESDKIKLLTAAVLELKSQIDGVNQTKQVPGAVSSSNSEQIASLEDRVVNLQTQITQLSASPATTTQATANKSPVVYIPLGSEGQGGNTDWYTLTNYEIQLNPADYPGYTNMQLEVSFRLAQDSGTGYSRLFNATDNADVGISVQTTSSSPQWYQSYFFKPASGTKTYRLQIKSVTGTQIYVQSARIRVNF